MWLCFNKEKHFSILFLLNLYHRSSALPSLGLLAREEGCEGGRGLSETNPVNACNLQHETSDFSLLSSYQTIFIGYCSYKRKIKLKKKEYFHISFDHQVIWHTVHTILHTKLRAKRLLSKRVIGLDIEWAHKYLCRYLIFEGGIKCSNHDSNSTTIFMMASPNNVCT